MCDICCCVYVMIVYLKAHSIKVLRLSDDQQQLWCKVDSVGWWWHAFESSSITAIVTAIVSTISSSAVSTVCWSSKAIL
jgi:hypothetical protein